MQEIDNILFAMVVSTSVIFLMCGLFIAVIIRHLKGRVAHKNTLFESIFIAQEEERGRIAMDIHDDLGSMLLGLKLNLDDLHHYNEISILKTGIENATSKVVDAIRITRLTSQTLMPETLKKYGLNSALKDLISRYKNSVDITIINNIEERLPQILEINLYRILSELLTNTVKHAMAKNVQIEVIKGTNQISVKYTDNGIGFDYVSMLNKTPGIGINNIKNRVDFLKGSIQVNFNPGTNFLITFPI